jgi:hypothetical protein
MRFSSAAGALATLAALSILASPAPSFADKKPAKKAAEAPPPPANNEAPITKGAIKLVPDGMKWGMVRADLEKMVDKFIDDDFRPQYKAAGKSAPKIKDLDVEAANQKSSFRRSFIDLVPGPLGLDAGPLAAEYTKGNGEALMSHRRGPGVKIWFFFIGGRLWKTLEEVSLIDGGLYGKDLSEAIPKILESVGKTNPRRVEADPDKGNFYDVFDWQDGSTHMRMWDRSGVLVIAREDKATLAALPNLRKNSGGSKDAIDPSIAAIMRDKDAPAPPEKKEEKKDDKKGKKK